MPAAQSDVWSCHFGQSCRLLGTYAVLFMTAYDGERRRPCTVPYMRSPAGFKHYHLLICLPPPTHPCSSLYVMLCILLGFSIFSLWKMFDILTESNICRLSQFFSVFFSLIRSLIGYQLASLCVPQL